MANARVSKKKESVGMEAFKCPGCDEAFTSPIYLCQCTKCLTRHSLCSDCTAKVCQKGQSCSICREPMTMTRNSLLEDQIAKLKVPCPNKDAGCVYTMSMYGVEEHLMDCIFRNRSCPLGDVFEKCSWKGKLKDIMKHFKDCHPQHCTIGTETDVDLKPVSVEKDFCHVFLLEQYKQLFIVTAKIDTNQKMAYWLVQHMGSKKVAHQHVYEVHISDQEKRRKILFSEYCFSETMNPDNIIQVGKCGIVPLSMLSHFIENQTLTFQLIIRRSNQSKPTVPGQQGPQPSGKRYHGPRPGRPGRAGP